MKWTENNIGDLKGKTIIVTGGNSGLGFESSRLYTKYGATVILASRNESRGTKALNQIKQEFPKGNIELMLLDLGSKKSIEQFVTNFKQNYNQLDILLNNAGIMAPPYESTTDGFESQIGVNYLGHFYLTGLLFPIIKKTKNARIINISSIAHRFGQIDLDTFVYQKENTYNKSKAYAQSKIANLFFTKALARRIEAHHLDTLVLSAHPGISRTNLFGPTSRFNLMMLISQNQYKGSLPGIRASIDPNAKSGEYYGPRGLFSFKGFPKKRTPKKLVNNEEISTTLWEESKKLLQFDFKI